MRRIEMRNKKATIILMVLSEDRYSLELIVKRGYKDLHCEVTFNDKSELGTLLKKAIDPLLEERSLTVMEVFQKNRLRLMKNLAGVLDELGETEEERSLP